MGVNRRLNVSTQTGVHTTKNFFAKKGEMKKKELLAVVEKSSKTYEEV